MRFEHRAQRSGRRQRKYHAAATATTAPHVIQTRVISSLLIRRGERAVKRGLEDGVGPRARDDVQDLDALVARVFPADQSDDEVRRGADTRARRVRYVLANLGRVLVAVHALLELGRVDFERLRVSRQGFGGEGALVLEELVVHLPELALLAGAALKACG